MGERDGVRPVRVAQVIGKVVKGGVEAVVTAYDREMDHEEILFDYYIDADSTESLPEDILRSGARCFVIPPYRQLPRYIMALVRAFRRERYRIVHVHMNTLSVFALSAAWAAGVPVRICHNHSTAHRGEGRRMWLKLLLRPFARTFATDLFACGDYAGRWLYGRKAMERGEVTVVRNAIDVRRFVYDPDVRASVRRRAGWDGAFVVGHIGRFMPQKHHVFLLEIFRCVHAHREGALLLLVGDGPLRGEMEARARDLGIGDAVIFAGTTDRPEDLYQAMDVFCLPSLFEGNPVAAIEAQASGLCVIASSEVSQEARVTDRMRFLPLSAPPEQWAEELLRCEGEDRPDLSKEMTESGYDIRRESGDLERYYLSRC